MCLYSNTNNKFNVNTNNKFNFKVKVCLDKIIKKLYTILLPVLLLVQQIK